MHVITPRRWLAIVAMAGIALFAHNVVYGSVATATIGQTVTFTVIADGTQPFTYQWHKGTPEGAVDIAGATNSTYTISGVQVEDAGNYTVTVHSFADPTLSTLSDTATLTVTAAAVGPANDNFANATEINAQATQLNASNANATPCIRPGIIGNTPLLGSREQAYQHRGLTVRVNCKFTRQLEVLEIG